MKMTRLLTASFFLAALLLGACKKPHDDSKYEITSFTPVLASVGTDVTLRGVFGTNPTVKVNGTVAIVKSSNDSQIVFTIPSGATTGKIMVNCDGGVSLSSATDLEIITTVINKTFGGSQDDGISAISRTSDGGTIMAGHTRSNDGNVSGYHGSDDAWVVKLDANGNKLWQKPLGGSDDDYASSLIATSDGVYLIAGETYSNDSDVSNNYGGGDAWVVKLKF